MAEELTSIADFIEEIQEKGINPDGVIIDRKHVKILEPFDDEESED